ncbi:hypothetical protein GMD78_10860 [Ornithinibacillus sp. L9]|uniref:N-acetyltransferase domain-containing protein n=1 Tax=Ornithinibacillus caprae TaxID=2678566 RepID=A0A6N8FHH7_9BACI|nr:hypothetical protein [Ornithinibacillus caprae]MUK88893.1 hypothetical protein [Ornithinibacillus caprae]
MKPIIRNYETKDEKQLKQLIRLTNQEDYFVHLLASGNTIQAFSAVFEERLVGVIIAWKSKFHPYCTYIRIVSNPILSYSIFERDLLEMVETNLAKVDYPLQVSVWDSSVGLIDFYNRNGFELIRKTYMTKLQLDHVQDLLFPNQTEDIKSLAEIIEDEVRMRELTKLVKANYEETHRSNPVADFDENRWKALILEDILLDGSFIQFDQTMDNILAYSFLHHSDDHVETLELGWCGCRSRNDRSYIPNLVIAQIQYGLVKGYTFLQGEFDTTDDYALEVLRNIPFPPCAAWNTYQKK